MASSYSLKPIAITSPDMIQMCSYVRYPFLSNIYEFKELGWKQTEFEMWPDFHNTLPSCIFIRDPNCGLLPRIWRISYTYFWWHINSNQINCLSSITLWVAAPSPEPEAHVLSVQAFRIELEFRSASFWRVGKTGAPWGKPLGAEIEPTTNLDTCEPSSKSNPGHIGGRRVLSPLRQPCSPHDVWC